MYVSFLRGAASCGKEARGKKAELPCHRPQLHLSWLKKLFLFSCRICKMQFLLLLLLLWLLLLLLLLLLLYFLMDVPAACTLY